MRGEPLVVKLWRKTLFHRQRFIEIEWPAGTSFMPDFSRTVPGSPPSTAYWADPFRLDGDERLLAFVEEPPFSTNKGHISVVEVDDQGQVVDQRVILEGPYHVSYPYLLEWEGEFRIPPETGGNRSVESSRCERFPRLLGTLQDRDAGSVRGRPAFVAVGRPRVDVRERGLARPVDP